MLAKNKKPKLIVILGPTASGKTSLSIKLAKKFKGQIVSADSRQIYKHLDLGTGKITKKEMQGVPHFLLDIVLPRQKYSVAKFQKKATSTIKQIAKKGYLPFLVGGSSFYLYSVIDGWDLPETKTDWKLRRRLQEKSPAELLAILKKLDARRAQTIEQQNPRRLIRAIEIASQLGSVPKIKNNPQFDCLILGVKRDEETLRKLITKRLKQRFEDGMLKEVRDLYRKKILSPKRLEELGLEYRWIGRHIMGKINFAEMFERLDCDIWRFSRHQMNWFKKDKNIHWVESQTQAQQLIKNFLAK